MSDQILKDVNGELYPAEDFAYVPDQYEISTWKLPIFDAKHAEYAMEALRQSGFEGRQVAVSKEDRQQVYNKVKSAFQRFYPDREWPTAETEIWVNS